MHRPSLLRLRAALVLAFVAVLALSACSRRETADTPASGGAGAVGRRHPGRRAAPRLLPEHHPRPRADRRGQRLLPAGAGLDEAHHADLQRGPRRGLRAARQLAGRRLHRLRPGHQRLREVATARPSGWSPGSTSGGAQLVVSPDITSPDQLKGKIIATPQAGNTQDIALKKWLKENNLTNGTGPDAVTVQNIDNPRTLDLFKSGQVAGGWLPEPWSSRLVDAGAKVLVDEKSLWPDGQFPTTVLIVGTAVPAGAPADRRGAAARRAEVDRLRERATRPRPRR